MKLQHQIALALRHRPLVLPMLLATICVDAVVVAGSPWNNFPEFELFFFFGHLALLAYWTSRQSRYWHLRLGISVVVLIALSLFYRSDGHFAPVTSSYYGLVLIISLVHRFWRYWRKSGPFKSPRFSLWQILLVTTVSALILPLARQVDWQKAAVAGRGSVLQTLLDTVLVYGVFVCIPFCTEWVTRKIANGVKAFVVSLVASVTIGFCFAYFIDATLDLLEIVYPFLTIAAICCLWFLAVRVHHDPKRRLAARRKRRNPKLTVVGEAVDDDIEAETVTEPPPATRIDAEA